MKAAGVGPRRASVQMKKTPGNQNSVSGDGVFQDHGQRLKAGCRQSRADPRILQIPGRWNFKGGSSPEQHRDKIGEGAFIRF